MRQVRLLLGFGVLGTLFGAVFAAFYLVIGHKWGALIITVCSAGFAISPFLMRQTRNTRITGHFLILVLVTGFTALCCVEGGLQGHAIAWLVSVPLCAFLMLGLRAATHWAMVAFTAAGVFGGLDLAGIKLPATYDPKWASIISVAGYLGLITFMFMLGMLFELNRRRAHFKMQQALAELAGANERLVNLNQEKNEFMGIAAHDLRNPLTVILAAAEMAALVKDRTETAELLNNITEAAARMNGQIKDLLDFNAIEQGKFTSNPQPCEISLLVEQAVKNNRPAARKKTITIRVGTSEGLWARTCPAAAMEILDNLISNALKYSAPNTTIHVHTLPETNAALVSVRDEGPGISAEDQKRMFQKYTRLTARPTGGESSTGLGLAIAKRLAEAMSGSIQCHSKLGAGSTFTLRLPICPPPPAAKIIETPPFDAEIRTPIPESLTTTGTEAK